MGLLSIVSTSLKIKDNTNHIVALRALRAARAAAISASISSGVSLSVPFCTELCHISSEATIASRRKVERSMRPPYIACQNENRRFCRSMDIAESHIGNVSRASSILRIVKPANGLPNCIITD